MARPASQPPRQRDLPPEVPPLAATGERVLPDVPEDNYMFRRHLAVYEWVAERVRGLDVVDMACGEGYGADVLARGARSVVGVDASGESIEHASLRYRRANLRFECERLERFTASCDAIVCLQTIEHLVEPEAALRHFRSLLTPRGAVYLSTPNLLTQPRRPGATKSDNPFHVREYAPDELARLGGESFSEVKLLGLFHARKVRAHEVADRLGWQAVHPRLRLTRPFYRWFIRTVETRDFVLRSDPEGLDRAHDLIAVLRP